MRWFPQVMLDLMALAGLAAMVWGVRMIHEPSAWIIGGLALLSGATLLAWQRERERARR